MSAMLDAALEYASRGLPVFPIAPGAKKPPLTANGFKDASTDPEQIRTWWTAYPTANIGIPTGKVSGWTALDVDIKEWEGKRGDVTLAGLEGRNGPLPQTLTQQTWSGGRQHVFQYVEGLGNSAGKVGKDLDIRGDGGYIVVVPSFVREGGREGSYQWTVEVEPAVMPDWLIEGAARGRSSDGIKPPFTVPEEIPAGQRNDVLYRIGRSLKAKGLSDGAIRVALEAENQERCKLPLDPDEIGNIVRSVLTQADRPEFQAVPAPTAPAPEIPYAFRDAFGPDHFVTRFIRYAESCTDTASEFHEAGALSVLAGATPGVKVQMKTNPDGLGTNLFLLGIGDSTTSRKSTSKNIARRAMMKTPIGQAACLPDLMTPEALLQEMASRDGAASVLFVDEFGALMGKLHAKHMEGFKGHLLSLHDGLPVKYTRVSKKDKDGIKQLDREVIEDPHLTIFGVCTPSLFRRLSIEDIETGLLPRFAIIFPQSKPAWQGVFEGDMPSATAFTALADWLAEIQSLGRAATVTVEADAQRAIDAYGRDLAQRFGDQDDAALTMYARMNDMLIKVSTLAAIGRPDVSADLVEIDAKRLTVTLADVEAAKIVLGRWEQGAAEFISRLSASEFDRLTQRCAGLVQKAGTIRRKVLAQNTRIGKRLLDDIEATLVDRGQITVTGTGTPGVSGSGKVWQWIAA